ELPAQTISPDFVDGVIYFKLNDTSSVIPDISNPPSGMEQLIAHYQVTSIIKPFRTPDIPIQHIYKMRFSDLAGVDSLANELSNLPYVDYAEKAPLQRPDFLPNDFNSGLQWGLAKIHGPSAWNISTGDPSVVIAIVDNAINYNHQDLMANRWVNSGEIGGNGIDDDLDGYTDDVYGYDVADNDGNPQPPPGAQNTTAFMHGTHCAGIACAVTNNGLGISSIGYNCHFMSVKCSPNSSDGSTLSNTFEGVDYAISAGANIISMSFGSTTNSLTWNYLFQSANLHGIVLVAAAGNSSSSTPYYPAADQYVIAVGATESDDSKAFYSNYGSWIDVMAPGSSIYSTLPDGGNTYGSASGTSMATPLTAGVAGLILSALPGSSPAQVETALKNGCENIDAVNPSYAGLLGSGRINAYYSLQVNSIKELSENVFSVFPTAGDGDLFISTDSYTGDMIQIDVYSLSGEKEESQSVPVPAIGSLMEFNLRGKLAEGMYILYISDDKRILSGQKIIITEKE
ncbi:MAG TPA: S8 family serine peptidase, partial [Bacteroidia bacterium]|nr:S8 family serine peptidase [Bacteroidia bacterium]